MNTRVSTYLLYLVWIVAAIATAGSLFFSEILKMPPCVLCWYQRICMYPLVIIVAAGIFLKDKKVYWYALPLAIIGGVIALYHNLLYWKILPESVAPCEAGVSCTTKFIEWFGFITIPFLSLAAFTVIVISLILSIYLRHRE
jgi:disulfide bond formation protein DsbB